MPVTKAKAATKKPAAKAKPVATTSKAKAKPVATMPASEATVDVTAVETVDEVCMLPPGTEPEPETAPPVAIGPAKQAGIYEWVPTSAIDAYKSLTQIPGRTEAPIIAQYGGDMVEGRWDWERPGSQPILFRDEAGNLHCGDGHKTFAGAKFAKVEKIYCYILEGTFLDAKIYSYTISNRQHGALLTNIQRRAIAESTILDLEMLEQVCQWIDIKVGKACPREYPPASRAISEYLGNISHTLVSQLWDELSEAVGEEHPHLLTEKRLGVDGKVRKIDVAPPKTGKRAEAAAAKSAPSKAPATEQDQDDSFSSPTDDAPAAPPTSSPAPTNSAPATPTKRYTGKGATKRINEYADEIALKIIAEMARTMVLKVAAIDMQKSLNAVLVGEMEYFVSGAVD